MQFISEANRQMHEEYLRTLKLEYSIYEKSYPDLVGKSLREITRLRFKNRGELDSAVMKKCEIMAHELYFRSFGNPNSSSVKVRQAYGSEADFLYEASEKCMSADGGFLLIYPDFRGRISMYAGREYKNVLLKFSPALALDLCEHAYFYDYSFDKKSYVSAALSHIALERLMSSNLFGDNFK